MKKLILFLIMLSISPCYSETINTWLGTGLAPLTTSEYPERDGSGTFQFIGTSSYSFNRGISHNNNLFVINRDTPSKLYKSSDGVNWTLQNNSAPFGGGMFVDTGHMTSFKGKIWVFGSCASNDIWCSSDEGVSWSIATTTAMPLAYHNAKGSCVIGDYAYVSDGVTVLKTSDGIHFTVLTTSCPGIGGNYITMSSLGNYLIIRDVFYGSGMLKSLDGINWEPVYGALYATPGYTGYGSLVYNGRYYEGKDNYVTYTSNLSSWFATTTAGIPIGVMKGRMYFFKNRADKQVYRSY